MRDQPASVYQKERCVPLPKPTYTFNYYTPTKLASIMVLSVTLLFVPIILLDCLWQLLRLSREMEAHLLQ